MSSDLAQSRAFQIQLLAGRLGDAIWHAHTVLIGSWGRWLDRPKHCRFGAASAAGQFLLQLVISTALIASESQQLAFASWLAC